MTNVGEKDVRFEIWRNHSELKQLLNNPLLIFSQPLRMSGMDRVTISWQKKLTLRGQSFLITGEGGGGLRRILEGDSGGAEGGSVVANRRV